MAGACGEVPLVPLSTGTNNVFPESREATIAGLATGLVPPASIRPEATDAKQILRLDMNGVSQDLAVVDISVSEHRWVGSKALWRPEMLDQIFVAFAESGRDWTVIRGRTHPACLPARTSWPATRFGAAGTGGSYFAMPDRTWANIACRN